MTRHKTIINNELDLIRAKQLLTGHKDQLVELNAIDDTKAYAYTNEMIAEIEAAIMHYATIQGRKALIQQMLEDVYNGIKNHSIPTWNMDYWKGYCRAMEVTKGYVDLYADLSSKVHQLFNNIRSQVLYPFAGIQ